MLNYLIILKCLILYVIFPISVKAYMQNVLQLFIFLMFFPKCSSAILSVSHFTIVPYDVNLCI